MHQTDAELVPKSVEPGTRYRKKRWPFLKVKVPSSLKLRLYALALKGRDSQELQAMAAKAMRIGVERLEKRVARGKWI